MSAIFSNPLVFLALLMLGFLAISFLPGFLAALFETRMVWPYQSASEFKNEQPATRDSASNPYAPPSKQDHVAITSYANATCLKLEALGFSYHDVYYDRRRGIYKLRTDFWLSPDRLVLATVGGGTLAGIAVAGTCLYTRLDDGHCLLTIDEPKSQDSDLSGLTVQKIVTHVDLDELIAQHHARLTESESPGLPYSARTPLDDHRAFRMRRADVVIDSGLGRYVDAERNGWRFTLKGAWTVMSNMYFRELKRQLKEPGRDRVARQGERGYVRAKGGASRVLRIVGPLQYFCGLAMIISFVLSQTNGPARNQSQLIFRLAVPAVAGLAMLILQIIKWMLVYQSRSAAEAPLESDRQLH